jgi:uncharacterized membrane protein YdjX (TVP38/TMEM64 family)
MLKFTRAVLLQLLWIGGLIGIFVAALHFFPVEAWIADMQRRVGQMQWWGGILYPLLLAGCNLLLLPAGVLAVGSGLMFGLWWGFFLVWAGTVLGSAVAFQIGRRLGRQWILKRLNRRPRWRALDDAIGKDGWKIILLTQIHPLFPTSLLHYLYGVTRIRFSTCLFWVAVGQIPGLFLYVYIGTLTQLGIRLFRGETHPLPVEYVVWLGGLTLTVVVTALLARVAIRILKDLHSLPEGEDAPGADAEPDPTRL